MSDARQLPSTVDGWRLRPAVDYLVQVQLESGRIPWYRGGPTDPWDHVEAAMGLTVGGRYDAAAAAYRWLADTQLDDGSWWSVYGDDGQGEGERRETHRSAYVATGVWHHYLVTGDRRFLEELWPTVEHALDFAVDHQQPTGEIAWACFEDGPDDDALVTATSSVVHSLISGTMIAQELGTRRPGWLRASDEAAAAVRSRPDRFDRTWESKANFAMDWFYPVLCGIITGDAARDRLAERADEFVEPGLGCRCDVTEPWVTVAESAELVMALVAAGKSERAADIFEWLFRWRDENGVFWTGYQFEDDTIWPEERATWTTGAVLLAADALGDLTPASAVFTAHE